MCGIAGAWHPEETVDGVVVSRLLAGLRHRGPDGAGLRATPRCVLGHHRLAIHDLTAAGLQPMTCPGSDDFVAVNGTIHNAPELRRELEAAGERLESRSDSAVLLPLYHRHGPDFLDRLTGPFALALWDAARERLLLARDRLGQKPLFVEEVGGGLRFASEAGSLLRSAGSRSYDPAAAAAFLQAGYVPGGNTVVHGVRSLPPASVLLADRTGIRTRRWWSPPVDAEEGMTRADARDRLGTALAAAVARRTRTERPLGVLLSGGLDSTAVLALATGHLGRPLPTFTLGFDAPGFDERSAAAATAEALGCPHHATGFPGDPGARLLELLETTGELLADASLLPTSAVCAFARREATVLLVGDGGDEILLGYRRHGMAQWIPRLGPRGLRGLAARLQGLVPARRLAKALSVVGGDGLGILADLVGLVPRPLWRALVVPELARGSDPLSEALRRIEVPEHGGAAAGRRDLLTYLPGDLLPKIDRAAMLHGVEVWSPFLDHEVVETALLIPGPLRRGLFRGKQPLRDLLRGSVPEATLRRPKRGFGVPLASWLAEGAYGDFAARALSRGRAAFDGVLRTGDALPLLERVRKGAAGLAPFVHACVVLALFHEAFVAGSHPDAATCDDVAP